MGVTADSVVVDLEARFEKARAATNSYVSTFEGGMTRIQSSGAKAEGSIVSAGSGMAKGLSVGTLAAGAAVLAFGLLAGAAAEAKKAMDFADEIADTAKNLHITTDQLQEYRFALQKAGGDGDDFAAGLNNLSEKLGAAKSGAKEALKPFQQLGFTSTQLQSLNTGEEALRAISDRVAALGSSAEQDSVIKALGVEKLAPLILQGTDEMARLRAEAQSIGVVMDEALIRKAADAKDEFDALNKVIDVQMKSALADLAPLIVGLIRLTAEWAVRAGDVVDNFRKAENRRSASLQRDIDLETGLLQRAQARQRAGVPFQQKEISDRTQRIQDLQSALAKRAQDDPGLVDTALERLGITRTGTSLAKVPGRPGKPKDPEVTTFLPSAVSRKYPEEEALREKLQKEFEDRLSEAIDGFDASGLVKPEKYDDAWEKLAVKFSESARKAEEEYRDSIRDGVIGGLEAAADGDGVAYLASILRRRLFEAVADAIANAMTAQQSQGGGGGVGGALLSVGNFLFGRAAGGNVVGGKPYYVHRDELFVPAQSGRIMTPNQRAAASGVGGGATTVINHFELHSPVVTEDLLNQMNAIGAQAAHAGAQGGAQLAQAQMARRSRQVLR